MKCWKKFNIGEQVQAIALLTGRGPRALPIVLWGILALLNISKVGIDMLHDSVDVVKRLALADLEFRLVGTRAVITVR